MEIAFPILIIAGIAGLVGVILLFVYLHEKKRTQSFEQSAAEMGLNFSRLGDAHLLQRMSRFQLFSRGRARKTANVVAGETDEVTLAIFDYQYTTGSGKHAHTHRQTVVAIESEVLAIPHFTMRPTSMFDRIGSVFGLKDIDFEEHAEFSSRYLLKSPSEDLVREFFDPQILDFFGSRNGICVEGAPGQIVYFRSGKRIKPETIKEFLAEGYQVFGLFADRQTRAGV